MDLIRFTLGYFEGIDSERGIAWQLADSTISRTRRFIDVETHREVFGWVLGVLADRGLVKGKRTAIDAINSYSQLALYFSTKPCSLPNPLM